MAELGVVVVAMGRDGAAGVVVDDQHPTGRRERQGGDEVHQLGKFPGLLARLPKLGSVEIVIIVGARGAGEIDHARARNVGRPAVEQERAGVELQVAGALETALEPVAKVKVEDFRRATSIYGSRST